MLIFALDSTAAGASVAICKDDCPLASYTVQSGNNHSKTLLPMAQSLLRDLSLTPADIDLFACTAGPGSFTGVRIGAATVKGLAFGTNTPCVGVSSLEALAYNLTEYDGILCPVINARKFVYFALFLAKEGAITRLCEDSIVPVAELASAITERLEILPNDLQDLPLYPIGDAYDIALSSLGAFADRIRHIPSLLREQSAVSIAKLARIRHAQGEYGNDRELAPVYLRPCQAEREREERLQAAKEHI